MMRRLGDWFAQWLEDTELVMLFASLLAIFLIVVFFGRLLAPLLFAIAAAYVLDGVVELLVRLRLPRLAAVLLTGLVTTLILLFLVLSVAPLLTEQIGRLVAEVPQYVQALRAQLQGLQSEYGDWIKPEFLQEMIAKVAAQLQEWGGALLSFSIASIPGVITLLVYVVLVPVLVFFLLKDKRAMLAWARQFLPRDRRLLGRVWRELDAQLGNYIRGKVWETVAVGVAMWLTYAWMGHEYALLLALLTGLSVWVPFVGAAVVTVPVALLSFFQWGWSDMTLYALLAYAAVQALDANLLVPWLFSEMVNLHPVAIIVAVLVFGGFWGIVGVVIAIPLAALVKSVLAIVMERRAA
ncbi:MAG: AI-2E family transporter [Mariprofundaceae bacterium]